MIIQIALIKTSKIIDLREMEIGHTKDGKFNVEVQREMDSALFQLGTEIDKIEITRVVS